MSKLKPCPFCGSDNLYVDGYDHAAGQRWRVVCLSCMAMVDPGTEQQKHRAIEAWNRRAQPSEKPKPLTLMLGGGKYWIADYVCPDSGDVGICAYPRESDDGVIGAADSSCVGKSTDDVGAVLKIEFSKLESIDVVIRALEKAKANYRSKPKEEV